MKNSIFCLIVLFVFANCSSSDDDCGSDKETIHSDCILSPQDPLFMCCYSSQREELSPPLNSCPSNVDSSLYDDVKYLGFFEPLETTFMSLPSMDEGRDFIFQNQDGETMTLNYEHRNLRIGSSQSERHTSSSDSITLLCQERLHYDIMISSDELDYEMHISISTRVSYWGDVIYLNDYLVLRRSNSSGAFMSWPGNQLKLTIDKRNSLEEHLYSSNNVHFEEITLNGTTFQDVYSDSSSPSNSNVNVPINTYYFSYRYGLVGIKDEFDNLWVLHKID